MKGKTNTIFKRLLTGLLAFAMTVSLLPNVTLVQAVTGTTVAKDGSYTVTKTVEPNADRDFDAYDITVTVNVSNGKISSITTTGNGNDSGNDGYINKAVTKSNGINTKLSGQAATESTISGWDVVSGATCTSTAVKAAALAAIQSAGEATDSSKLTSLYTTIGGLTETDYTTDSWNSLQTALSAAQALTDSASQSDINTAATNLQSAYEGLVKCATDYSILQSLITEAQTYAEEDCSASSYAALQEKLTTATSLMSQINTDARSVSQASVDTAASELETAITNVEGCVYVMMNIPYSSFFSSDISNDVAVDVVSSATCTKALKGTTTTGTYHKTDGSELTGLYYPVKVTDVSILESDIFTEVDADELSGSASYAYYVLDSRPSVYKTISVTDGVVSFGKAVGTVESVDGITATLSTSTNWGDYELVLSSSSFLEDDEYAAAVVIHTTDGTDYGLRMMENIWKKVDLAWSVGFTTTAKGCTLSYAHYVSMMGKTIDYLTYYTTDGIYKIDIADTYVPVKFATTDVTTNVASISQGTDSAAVTISGLPEDYSPQVSVSSIEGAAYDSTTSKLTGLSAALPGSYTVTISDANEKYMNLTTTLTISTDTAVAQVNTDNIDLPTLVKASGASDSDLSNYIKNISSVSVNGTQYSASGKGAATIINSDGSLNTSASSRNTAIFSSYGDYTIVVTSAGYPDLTFTYNKAMYVLMNIPYSAFYAAEVTNSVAVDAVASATKSKTMNSNLVAGSYHVDSEGSDISGVIYPVRISDTSILEGLTQVTDETSFTKTVTNHGTSTTTTYSGADALFESASYSYYILSETPSCYKTASYSNGSWTFGSAVGTVTQVTDDEAEFTTSTSYGDYELDLSSSDFLNGADVSAVVLNTQEGDSYGLRHLENIWKDTELAWSVGYTTEVHGCTLSYDHYQKIQGQTITSVTYYTTSGIYQVDIPDTYVPYKYSTSDFSVEIADCLYSAGSTSVDISSNLTDFSVTDKSISVEGLTTSYDASTSKLYFEDALPGTYTATISDASGKYSSTTASFTLSTDQAVAAYDYSQAALVKTEDASDADFSNFIKNISSVSVNGTAYSATGRGATTVINTDGSLVTSLSALSETGSYTIVVTSAGYPNLTFTYNVKDDSQLTATVAKAAAVNGDLYTAASYSQLTSELKNAQNLLNSDGTQTQLDAENLALTQALNSLVAKATLSTNETVISNISNDTIIDDSNAYSTTMKNTVAELAASVFTADELERLSNGEKAQVYMTVQDASASVSTEEKAQVESVLDGNQVALYLDINLYKQIGSDSASRVTTTSGAITIQVTIPDSYINSDDNVARTYKIVRVHDGVASLLTGTYDESSHTFTFETDAFSTYALVYNDVTALSSGTTATVTSTDTSGTTTTASTSATTTASTTSTTSTTSTASATSTSSSKKSSSTKSSKKTTEDQEEDEEDTEDQEETEIDDEENVEDSSLMEDEDTATANSSEDLTSSNAASTATSPLLYVILIIGVAVIIASTVAFSRKKRNN